LQAERTPVAPVGSFADVLTNPHLRARGFFQEIEQLGMGRLTLPGFPYRLSRTPASLRSPAPRLGEADGRWAVAGGATALTPRPPLPILGEGESRSDAVSGTGVAGEEV